MHPSKRKGSTWEREIVRLAQEKGLEAERAYASNGRSLGCTDDVDVLIEGWRVQAKRRKALPAYLKVPPGADVTVFRQDRGEALCLVPLSTLLGLIERERARERIAEAGRSAAPGRKSPGKLPELSKGDTRDKEGEAVALGRAIEPLERVRAKARLQNAQHRGRATQSGMDSENFTESTGPQLPVRDKVDVGMTPTLFSVEDER